MAFFDFPEEKLRTYTGKATLPADFEAFWRSTLDQELSADLAVRSAVADVPVTAYQVYDMSYLGYGGARINTWVRIPQHTSGRLPAVLNFIGYSGSRGYPWAGSHFAQAGYVHITMDSRSQGWGSRHYGPTSPDPELVRGETAVPGVMTSGILDRDTYYYRRLYIDTIRLIQAVLTLDRVDPSRLVVMGGSQGGGLTLAAAGLAAMADIPLAGAMVDVPFLCDFPRAVGLTDNRPYSEIVEFLKYNPQFAEAAFATLAYFDGVNFARFIAIPALFSVALMDQTCPPSTVFAAYNTCASQDKAIKVWPWNDHEGGGDHMTLEQLSWLRDHLR